jgi:translation initiation factor 2D
LAPLRSSDRRKVVDQIIADYEIEVPHSEPLEGQTGEQAQASALTAVRNALLPEGAQSARFTTTVGADSHQVSGTVYAAQFPDEDMKIYWLKLESNIIPTGKRLRGIHHLLC